MISNSGQLQKFFVSGLSYTYSPPLHIAMKSGNHLGTDFILIASVQIMFNHFDKRTPLLNSALKNIMQSCSAIFPSSD